jgi:hypothetical protein
MFFHRLSKRGQALAAALVDGPVRACGDVVIDGQERRVITLAEIDDVRAELSRFGICTARTSGCPPTWEVTPWNQ